MDVFKRAEMIAEQAVDRQRVAKEVFKAQQDEIAEVANHLKEKGYAEGAVLETLSTMYQDKFHMQPEGAENYIHKTFVLPIFPEVSNNAQDILTPSVVSEEHDTP